MRDDETIFEFHRRVAQHLSAKHAGHVAGLQRQIGRARRCIRSLDLSRAETRRRNRAGLEVLEELDALLRERDPCGRDRYLLKVAMGRLRGKWVGS